VVGTNVAASTAADVRGARPVARVSAAPICTAALRRTIVVGSSGSGALGAALWASGISLSVTGAAFAASAGALRSALTPPTTNIDASIGRAINRLRDMSH
jgi:hypothetical protein